MYCSKCGTQLIEGTAFCSGCGQPVSGPLAPPAAYSAPPAGVPPYGSAPTAVPFASPYAGFWLRLVAFIIDALVAGVIVGILFMVGLIFIGVGSLTEMIRGMEHSDEAPPVAFILLILFVLSASLLARWIYYAYMESSPNQGTLGKMALGLIVTDLQGRRVTFGRATGRYFARLITGLIPCGVGYMMAGFTERKQALHDMIAGCLVLRKT
ncbi:MAG: RDD family protein [Candidatus Acidiferrales bacterium]